MPQIHHSDNDDNDNNDDNNNDDDRQRRLSVAGRALFYGDDSSGRHSGAPGLSVCLSVCTHNRFSDVSSCFACLLLTASTAQANERSSLY